MSKNIGGRPPKSESDKLSRLINIRLTDEQYEKLKQAADSLDYTVSHLLRLYIDHFVYDVSEAVLLAGKTTLVTKTEAQEVETVISDVQAMPPELERLQTNFD